MESLIAFIRAAAPWVAAGLLAAILAVRADRKKHQEKADVNYGIEGMCLGLCFGTAIAAALRDNTGLGTSLGMLIGLAVGLCIRKETEGSNK